jgi:hypothetical protein
MLALLGRRLTPSERLAAVVGGVLVDSDHLLDLALYRRAGRRRWRVLLLHGWEYVVLLLAAGAHRRAGGLARAAALGLVLHLALDQVANRPQHPAFYWLIFRLGRGFVAERLVDAGAGERGWVEQPWWRWV